MSTSNLSKVDYSSQKLSPLNSQKAVVDAVPRMELIQILRSTEQRKLMEKNKNLIS
jgi:hypothetical protein